MTEYGLDQASASADVDDAPLELIMHAVLCSLPACLTVAFALGVSAVAAEPKTLIEWDFGDEGHLLGWTQANHVQELRVANEALCGRIMDWDPFVRSPQFEITATPYQHIELRIKTDADGTGDLFWTNTTDSPYGGFSPNKRTPFRVIGDGKWHEYHVYPFWHRERKILLLRLDFPRPNEGDFGNKTFAVDWIRIADLGEPEIATEDPSWDFTAGAADAWRAAGAAVMQATPEGLRFTAPSAPGAYLTSEALRCDVRDKFWLHVEMEVDRGRAAYIRWVSSEHAGLQSAKFLIKPDGRVHNYNVDLSSCKSWSGDVLLLGLQPSNTAGATAVIRRVELAAEPRGEAEIECTYLGLEAAINRAGRPAPLVLNLINRGGTSVDFAQKRIDELTLPAGVRIVDSGSWQSLPRMAPFDPVTHRILVQADVPASGEVRLDVGGGPRDRQVWTGRVEFTRPISRQTLDYVPLPRPVESDYEIGAFYFPGWASPVKWQPIRDRAPQRKPVLGWYDEGNPECVDWQIKWAVEHGIQFFLVDWYWSEGNRHLEHWLAAFRQARYRRFLQWAVMWANHNRPGSHSEQDMRAVAQFWVDQYFGTPEYLRIDNKPVVMIWSPENLRRDLGSGGAKRALELARQVARKAGYEGIYFIAMKWPEASTDPAIIGQLAEDGYNMTSIYRYMHHGGLAEDLKHYSFELVARSSLGHWQSRYRAGVLPMLPNLSTGWDPRPWHGDQATVVYDRSVAAFQNICQDAKRFADQTGIKRLALGPLNEWGEGSYAEPNREFGFGMYDAVRRVFCKRPADGWPENLVPADVGLGPYDFPELPQQAAPHWGFERDAEGWNVLMGISDFHCDGGAIHFRTTSPDPAIVAPLRGADASRYRFVRIRMKIDSVAPGERAQLFWSTLTSPIGEANSVRFPLLGDGQFHEYVLPVHENGRWRGKIHQFRLDPCARPNALVTLDEIRLCESEPER